MIPLLLIVVLLLSIDAYGLRVVYDSGLHRCPCTFDVAVNVPRAVPISIQAIPAHKYLAWKRSGSIDSVVVSSPTVKPGRHSFVHRITARDEWALVIHSAKSVSVAAQVKSRGRPCFLSLSFHPHRNRLPTTTRIISGTLASRADAALLSYTVVVGQNGFFCTGSVISPHWVLTAAHCRLGIGAKVKVQDNPSSLRSVTQLHRHPKYKAMPYSNINDLKLLRLNRPLYVTPIKVYKGPLNLLSGRIGRETGVGRYRVRTPFDYRLRIADLPILLHSACARTLTSLRKSPAASALSAQHHICTYSDDCHISSCSGDSGAPLCVVGSRGEFVQVGVLSYTDGACGTAPDVYSNVAHHATWINSITQGEARFTSIL